VTPGIIRYHRGTGCRGEESKTPRITIATQSFTNELARLTFCAAAALLLLACEPGSGDERPAEFDPRRFEGTGLTLLLNQHPWVGILEPRLEEFQELTGITVSFEVYPEEQYRTKRTVEMRSGVSEIDLFMIMPGNSLQQYYVNGWVRPLDAYLSDDSLRLPAFDPEPFLGTALRAGRRNETQYVLPLLAETSILAYNRTILERYELEPPRTMEELEHVAREVHERSDGEVYGITLRGAGAAATSQWAGFLHSFGGRWVDDDGAAAIAEEDAVEALEFYARLLRNYGPRHATRNGWYESTALFMSGRAAMIYDANIFRSHYEDPAQSDVVGEVGYAVLPAGPAGSVPHMSHWGLAISADAEHPEAAWLFIQWATGRELALEAHLEGISSARSDVWDSAEFAEQNTPEDWAAATTRSYDLAVHTWNPPVKNVSQARDVVGRAIVEAVLGLDAGQAAARTAAALDAIIRSEQAEQAGRTE